MPDIRGKIAQLHAARNKYGPAQTAEKIKLLGGIKPDANTGVKTLQTYYECLLFMLAYPDNKSISERAGQALLQLESIILDNEKLRVKLYNTGISHSNLCAAFSFEMVKWLRQTDPGQVRFSSFEATNDQIKFILSAVMPKLESEILQDANAEWKEWLQQFIQDGKDMLDQLINIFDSAPLRRELIDELWNAMGVNVEINVGAHACLQSSLISHFNHQSLKRQPGPVKEIKAIRIPLTMAAAADIIKNSRMILVRHLREINPITFTSPRLVKYYQLSRGISIALMEMVADRRHPLDSYLGYMVFKNGLPVAYAGSWIMFDSARIGLNVFPSYRGGESQYIFQQVLLLHQKVYNLKRFTADPYQLGKQNSDGIRSGAFWIYYRAGFRPLLEKQRQLAEAEAGKIKADPKYRTPAPSLKKLADSRLQLILNRSAVNFDATDLSRAWAGILAKIYNNDRKTASENAADKLAAMLEIKETRDANLNFVLYNWAGLLLWNEEAILSDKSLRRNLKRLCILKACGDESLYIRELQRCNSFRSHLENIIREFVTPLGNTAN